MTKEDFIKEYNSYIPTSKLDAVKLVKDVSNLDLKQAKDLVDSIWHPLNDGNVGSRIAELLERKYDVVFKNIIFDKNQLTIEFAKLQLQAVSANLEKHFEYLCEIHIDENFPRNVNIQHIPTNIEDKRSDEVRH